jgi:hypothetical protein
LASPACDAVIVHEPAPVRWTVLALIEQLPAALNDTARPEEAVALTPKSGSPNVLPPSAPNAIVCPAFAIANACGTSGAAL